MPYDPTSQLQAGDLRHSITITAASTTRDQYGQPSKIWNTVLITRAKIQSTTTSSYKMLIQAGVETSQATHVITMRWPGSSISIESGMRVLFGDNTYQIEAVDNVLNRNRVVNLFCMVPNGDTN
jgi:SPP1 family predicted phage head-tail adaptor